MFQPAACLSHTQCTVRLFSHSIGLLGSNLRAIPPPHPASLFSDCTFGSEPQNQPNTKNSTLMEGFGFPIRASVRGFPAGNHGSTTCSAFDDRTCCYWYCCWASLNCLSVNTETVQSRSQTSAVWRTGREILWTQRALVWKEERWGEEKRWQELWWWREVSLREKR